MPLAGRLLPLGLLGAIAAAVLGAEHIGHLTALADRLADISAQIRIRLTVLLAAGMALVGAGLGFEAILGALTVIPVTWGFHAYRHPECWGALRPSWKDRDQQAEADRFQLDQ